MIACTAKSTAASTASIAGTGEAVRSTSSSVGADAAALAAARRAEPPNSGAATSSAATSSSVVATVGSGRSQAFRVTSRTGARGSAHGRKAMRKARPASPSPTRSSTGSAGPDRRDRDAARPGGTPYPLMDVLSDGWRVGRHPTRHVSVRRPPPSSAGGDLADQPGGLARRAADSHPGGLERLLLGLGGAGGAGDDRAGVTHRLALRRGEARHIPDHRLGDVRPHEVGGPLLGVPADLADHDDRIGLRVVLERREAVDVGGPDHRVAADPDRRREADVAQLVHHLVRQRARLGDQPDPSGAGDVGGDDAGVRPAGADQAGAVRPDQPGGARPLRSGEEDGRVVHGNALGDDDHERHRGVDALLHRRAGEARGHEDDRHVGAGLLDRLGDGAEDGDAVDLLARLARVDAADDLTAGRDHPAGMPEALGAGHPLDDHPGRLGEKNGHSRSTPQPLPASSATRSAAPSMVSTCSTPGSAASVRIRRPRSALLPSSRTTSGSVTASSRDSSSRKACTIPFATSSQAVIPPKTFTRTDRTDGSARMISSPFAITSAEAPPPMSRKLAGRTPPCRSPAYATTSRVDMTRPAPLPMMPTSPSSLT